MSFIDQGNNASPRQPMMNSQNNRMRPQQQRSTGAPSSARNSGEPMKFDSEFDFESANAKFEQEIEKEFDKLKISGKSSGNQANQVCRRLLLKICDIFCFNLSSEHYTISRTNLRCLSRNQ